ncbi:MAG TPA: hypothetical protein DCY20_03695 [Firmicutes bacterium]|nr:hypothetical protein [Bacillota bacterium]
MKNRTIIMILGVCFTFGVVYGMNSNASVVTRGDAIKQEITQYETTLSESNSDYVPISVRESEQETDTQDSVQGVVHNNVSKFGQDAGEMLKVGVREFVRFIVQACDQLISE